MHRLLFLALAAVLVVPAANAQLTGLFPGIPAQIPGLVMPGDDRPGDTASGGTAVELASIDDRDEASRRQRPGARAVAEPNFEEAPLYYIINETATVYRSADTSQPYLELDFREPVRVIDDEFVWARVRTMGGAVGYIKEAALSNIWVHISKRDKQLKIYRGGHLAATYAADFGTNDFLDKERQGSALRPDHWRTPEGVYYVTEKNPESTFYKALVLNYPTAEDARRGIREGIISHEEYEAIIDAQESHTSPPMNTALGGWIEIHGEGSGAGLNWTHGCVAIHNSAMDKMWNWITVGTPVLIEP